MSVRQNLLQRFFRCGSERPLPTLVLLAVLSLIAALGLPRLQLDSGSARLARRDDPERQAYLRVAREFGSDQRSVVVLRDPELWTPARLQALQRLHDELQRLPFVERLDDLFTLRSVRSIDGQLQALPLLATAPADAAGAERARREVLANPLADPIAGRNLAAADGQTLAIGITLRERRRGGDDERERFDAIERVLANERAQFASLTQLGPQRTDAEIRQSLAHDLRVVVPASALLIALLFLVIFRHWLAALLPLVVTALSLLWTAGLMAWAGVPLSILSAMLPTLLLAVGASGIVRMLSGYSRGLEQTAERRAATAFMLRQLGAPAVLTLLTTAIGFASNAFAGIATIRDFGLAAAFALVCHGFITVLVVPLLYARLGPQRQPPSICAAATRLALLARRAFALLQHRPALWALAGAALAAALLVQQAPGLAVSNEPLSFLRAERPLVGEVARLQQDLAGPQFFYITLEAGAEGAFSDPANLQRVADIQGFIAKQQIFDRSLSLADVVAQANQAAAGGLADAYRVPPTRQLVAQYLTLHSPGDLSPYVSHDFRRANIVVRHNVRDSSTLNHYVDELREVIGRYAGAGMTATVVGENLMINAAADELLGTQAIALAALLAIVFVVISLMFTSVRGGLIALLPTLVPVLTLVGLMQVLEIAVNPGTVMLVAVAVGVACDGTIHLFSRYSELCRGATNYRQAVVDTVGDEAAPATAASLMLVAGFAALWLSDFAPLAQFGALAALAVLVSLAMNLLLTPLVMSRIRLVGLYEILALSTQRAALDGSPLFHGMSGYQIRKAILLADLHEHADGDRLIEQGTVGRSMFVVVSGELAVVRRDADAERRLATLGPGDVFGEIGYVRSTRRIADVRALGAVAVLCFDHARMEKDLAFFPHIMAKLNFNISGILGKRLAERVEAEHAPATTDAAAAPDENSGEAPVDAAERH